jgi:hypothetical protein
MNGDYIAFSAGAQTVPYVGRPFPLERAGASSVLARGSHIWCVVLLFLPRSLPRFNRYPIRNSIRNSSFLITWEAAKHEGPRVSSSNHSHLLPTGACDKTTHIRIILTLSPLFNYTVRPLNLSRIAPGHRVALRRRIWRPRVCLST